jgi:hypothetical protein
VSTRKGLLCRLGFHRWKVWAGMWMDAPDVYVGDHAPETKTCAYCGTERRIKWRYGAPWAP